MSCDICCENYNLSTRKCIKCPYCPFECCSICSRTYILNEKVSTCMDNSCQKEWTRKFMVESFPKTFINKEWKNMKMEKEVENEKSLLPATQLLLQNSKKGGKISKEVQFYRKCSVENCRGYLSSDWKCGLCSTYTCKYCHLEKKEGHICDKDLVATISFLQDDTKPCPKCTTPIHKIDGCDQMWCTMCHTAFSWRRGTIETRIHNPHYYEWLRNGGELPRNDGDYECGRNIENPNFIKSILKISTQQLENIRDIHNLKHVPGTNLLFFYSEKNKIYLFDFEKKILKELGSFESSNKIMIDELGRKITILYATSLKYIFSLHAILCVSKGKMELWDIESCKKIKVSSNEQYNGRVRVYNDTIFSIEKNVPVRLFKKYPITGGLQYFNRLCIYNINLELEYSIDFPEDSGFTESPPMSITIIENNDQFFIKNSHYRECELWNYKTGLKIKNIKNTSGGTKIVSIPNTTKIIYQDNSNYIKIYNYETGEYSNSFYMENRIKRISIQENKIYIGCFPTLKINIFSMELNLLKIINGYRLKSVEEYIITERQGYYYILNKDTYNCEKKIQYINQYIPDKNLFIGKRNNILYFTKMDEIEPIEIIQKTSHLDNIEANKFRTQNQINNEKIRLDYLCGKLSEEEFGRKINMAYKAYEKKNDLKSVLDLQVQGVTDIMYRLSEERKNKEIYLKEVEELTKYSNSLLKEYAKIYGCKEWKLNYKTEKVLE